MKRTRVEAVWLISLLILTACQTRQAKPPPTPSEPTPTVDTAGAVRYSIDSATSSLHILVYRAGTMARLGHNHVFSSQEMRGVILLHENIERSKVELTLPVATLNVDDAKARAAEGTDFAAEVPQDARDGTRRNLLRAEVLDGERFPAVKLTSTKISGTRARPELTMRVQIKDASRDVPVIANVRESGNTLTATGEFAVKQTEFGITPFSVGLGALQVQDEIKIKFSLVARKQQ